MFYWTAELRAHEKENPPYVLCGTGSGPNPRV